MGWYLTLNTAVLFSFKQNIYIKMPTKDIVRAGDKFLDEPLDALSDLPSAIKGVQEKLAELEQFYNK